MREGIFNWDDIGKRWCSAWGYEDVSGIVLDRHLTFLDDNDIHPMYIYEDHAPLVDTGRGFGGYNYPGDDMILQGDFTGSCESGMSYMHFNKRPGVVRTKHDT